MDKFFQSANMTDSQVKVALPCFEGYVKVVIWPVPDSVSWDKIYEPTNQVFISRVSAVMDCSHQTLSLIQNSLENAWSSPSFKDADMQLFLPPGVMEVSK